MKGLRITMVLITGGTSEIGQGIAVSVAVEGPRVAVSHRRHNDDAAGTGALSHPASDRGVQQVAVR